MSGPGRFDPARWTHGSRATYVAGCRDECCKRAEREYRRAYRARQRSETARPYRCIR